MRLLYEIEDDFNFLVNFFILSTVFGELFFGPIFLWRPFPYSLPSGSSALPLQRGRQPELWRVDGLTVNKKVL